MDIYPIHLRKKRIDYKNKNFLEGEALKINEGFERAFKELDYLKQHLNHMENKYKIKNEED
ncbi:hypothetical protein [Bacillus mobilis]|uniref:hypothetical protein n=1 Tax=Bacillus mobilis TaxID=2026190 RepID=UPI002E22DDB4|nr:hypothetical protein [Bacillus mobilis]MED0956316.1 hypothetical protein [Bacillus mobilis]